MLYISLLYQPLYRRFYYREIQENTTEPNHSRSFNKNLFITSYFPHHSPQHFPIEKMHIYSVFTVSNLKYPDVDVTQRKLDRYQTCDFNSTTADDAERVLRKESRHFRSASRVSPPREFQVSNSSIRFVGENSRRRVILAHVLSRNRSDGDRYAIRLSADLLFVDARPRSFVSGKSSARAGRSLSKPQIRAPRGGERDGGFYVGKKRENGSR